MYAVPFYFTLVLNFSIVIAAMDAGWCIDAGRVIIFGHPISGPPSPLRMAYWLAIVNSIATINRDPKPTPNTI